MHTKDCLCPPCINRVVAPMDEEGLFARVYIDAIRTPKRIEVPRRAREGVRVRRSLGAGA